MKGDIKFPRETLNNIVQIRNFGCCQALTGRLVIRILSLMHTAGSEEVGVDDIKILSLSDLDAITKQGGLLAPEIAETLLKQDIKEVVKMAEDLWEGDSMEKEREFLNYTKVMRS